MQGDNRHRNNFQLSTSLNLEDAMPASPALTINEITQLFITLSRDEELQAILIQHFHPDVIMSEIRRRRIPPPLLTTADLAKILRVSVYDIYRKQQNNELGIPYIPLGRGRKQGKKYDPRDVEEYIRKKKIFVVEKPESLKRVKRLRSKETEK